MWNNLVDDCPRCTVVITTTCTRKRNIGMTRTHVLIVNEKKTKRREMRNLDFT